MRILSSFLGLRANAKHVRSFFKYGNMKKLMNFMLAYFEFRRHRVSLHSVPFILNIEPVNICNLRCPLCPTGAGERGRPLDKMSLAEFKELIDMLGDYLYEVNLYDFGEPLLNEDIALMVEYAKKKNIFTCIGTNATLLDDRISEAVVRSGLDHLSVSIDGLSRETYARYRVGGDFEEVINNLKRVVDWKNRLKSPFPFIEWQFLVFKHNLHEVGRVKEFARNLGADGVYIRSARSSADISDRDGKSEYILDRGERIRKAYPEEEIGGGRPCDFLYFTLTVNPGGSVSPCCLSYKKEYDFDNIFQGKITLWDIWNNHQFRAARKIFRERRKSSEYDLICNSCRVVNDFIGSYGA